MGSNDFFIGLKKRVCRGRRSPSANCPRRCVESSTAVLETASFGRILA